jgi:hypothetical protein
MPARELNSLADVILAAMRAGRQTAMGIAVALSDAGRVVSEGGAAELSRLQALVNAQPADLSVPQLEALIDAGNGALADYYHERACACSDYPAGCATNPGYARAAGFWDTDAFAVGAPAVIGLWEVLRAADTVGEVAVLNAALAESRERAAEAAGRVSALRARNAELEAQVLASSAAAEQRHQLYDPAEPPLACLVTGDLCAVVIADALADALDAPQAVTG